MDMRIHVFCTKQFRGVHRHPKLEQVEEAVVVQRPHLASPHEHALELRVEQRCTHAERQRDLLNLAVALDRMTLGKVIDFQDKSFEQICMWFLDSLNAVGINHISVIALSVDGGVEGARIEFADKE